MHSLRTGDSRAPRRLVQGRGTALQRMRWKYRVAEIRGVIQLTLGLIPANDTPIVEAKERRCQRVLSGKASKRIAQRWKEHTFTERAYRQATRIAKEGSGNETG